MEVLAFVKRLLVEFAEEVVLLLDNISSMEAEEEEDVHVEEELLGAFSSFSTSLCSLEVSDVGVEDARVEGVLVVGPSALGKEEKGKES